MLPPLTSVATDPQDKKRELSWTPVQICTSKWDFPLPSRGLSLMISVTVYLQHSQIFTCSKEMPCFDADTLVSASSASSSPGLANILAPSSLCTRRKPGWISACIWTRQPHSASEGPQWAPAAECTFPEAGTHLGCDPTSWVWISYFMLNFYLTELQKCIYFILHVIFMHI